MSDRDDLFASMYDDDMQAAPKPIDPAPGTRRIKVGIIEYEVPTVEYVRQLEHLLVQQAHMLDQQRRAIHRIETLLHGTRNFVRRHGDVIGDMRSELTRKVDHT